jgi:GWxTD domain-containing protein
MRISSWKVVIAVLILTAAGCATVREVRDPNDLSYVYNPLRSQAPPVYRIFHQSDNITELSLKFFASNLNFSQANPEGRSQATMVLMYRLFDISAGRMPIDTAMTNLIMPEEEGRNDYIFNIPLEAPAGSIYEVEIVVRDIVRNSRTQRYIRFDKRSRYNRYNFRIRGHFDYKEIFTPVLQENEFVNILFPNSQVDSLRIDYYPPMDRVPDKPYLLIPERETDMVPQQRVALPYSDTIPIMLPRRGIYHFRADSMETDGYTLFNFGEDYPIMNRPAAMIEPLIYLTDQIAVDTMLNHPRPKIALDNFWVSTTNNMEQARELIRIYYNRVLYANLYFTSYKEGWRTDRGMIYIIYGPPDKVYKTVDGERWGYQRPRVKSGWGIRYRVEEQLLWFNFSLRENRFSNNHYTLLREESLTTLWEDAVRSWRNGVVFRTDTPTNL